MAQPNLASYGADRQAEQYTILTNTNFVTNNLAVGETRAFTIVLDKNTQLLITSLTAHYTLANELDPTVAEQELLVQIYDARKLLTWFVPDPVPLSIAFGRYGCRELRVPTWFNVPQGVDMIVEYTNKTAAAIAADISLVLSGYKLNVPGKSY